MTESTDGGEPSSADDREATRRNQRLGSGMRPVLWAVTALMGRRWGRKNAYQRRRRGPTFFVFGLSALIVLLSVSTCSAGVDLASMTAEYGPPIPASRDAARRVVERTATGFQNMANTRGIRFELTDVEATSVLTLGLMMPEMMRASQSMSEAEARSFDDLAELREHLRHRFADTSEAAGLIDRAIGIIDPRLRTGDVQVRFTREGEIVIAGYIQAWRWQQPALAVFAPRLSDGELELDFRKGRLGRIPAPERAFDLLGALIASLMSQGRGFAEIQELTVNEGMIRFVGMAKP